MDSETSLVTITNSSRDDQAQEKEGAFHASWEAADAALLHPSNLTIPKARRAWDRQPLKPFTTQKNRVGRVWKRPMSAWGNTASKDAGENRVSKRRKARSSLSGSLKPVKKMCLASDFGLGARVLQWDAVESPMRKIVTRSNASSDEIVALPDESDEVMAEQEGDVTVEILDEDGVLLDIGGEELAQGQDWEDEIDGNNTDHEEPFDGIMMHLGDLLTSEEKAGHSDPSAEVRSQRASLEVSIHNSIMLEEEEEKPGTLSDRLDSGALGKGSNEQQSSQPVISLKSQNAVLPDGFLSPVKRSQAFSRRSARASISSRRRTLPQQFAPVTGLERLTQVESSSKLDERQAAIVDAVAEAEEMSLLADQTKDGASSSAETEPDQEWEDADQPSSAIQSIDLKDDREVELLEPRCIASEAPTAPTEEWVAENTKTTEADLDIEVESQEYVAQHTPVHANAKLPSIDDQHHNLSLRRSPRRKSSSPLKQSRILPSTEKPHIVAFTPLKGPPRYPSPSNYPGLRIPFLGESEHESEQPSPPERAASAPPEEPLMSPQKPWKPRISDDTALLQAFLNRAAQSKSSRRMSATKRESITNRRDSDAIRQALASPAKAEVLADLDPNSPSPRKPSATADNTGIFDDIELSHGASQEEQLDEVKSGRTTRRGDRAARRANPSTPAAPNKIAIRGNADNFLLKRSEAQELATLTRNNTRKNKGGAVLPPLRLTKLASQTNSVGDNTDNSNDATEAEKVTGSRNVRWAETLVEFYQGGEISEVSVLSDELNVTTQVELSGNADNEMIGAQPPPAAETPSKPRIRRLKAPKTVATPGKPSTVPPVAETDRLVVPEPPANGQTKPVSSTKRRSRIATPAKGLTNASLLPPEVEPEHAIQAAAAGKKVAPKKKTTVSKLPAPSTTATSVSTSLGQGKENLISSPPKKRAVPTAKVFAPKLDFAKKTQLPPAPVGLESGSSDLVPGLMSPAKKAKGRGIVFANISAPDFGTEKEEAPGLSSPAKKRTRRAGGF